jgi:N-acetylglucosaminyldiphosphoundecaprenol N-acetyl-beta-D-mannosaminyltransferase
MESIRSNLAYDTTEVMNYQVFSGSLETIDFSKKTIINTLNQYSYCIANNDDNFKNALLSSDILLPDGIAIVLASIISKRKLIKKIAGADLHLFTLNELNKKGGSCFYLGSSEKTLKAIQIRVNKEFPNIKVHAFSPPFKHSFTIEENEIMVSKINEIKPDVLFIGMTAPKQEKWAFSFKEKLDTKLICSIGAVFDFYGGTVKRPNQIWISIGLEWFIRLIKEPKRMWKRYLYYGPVFLYHMFRSILIKQN